MAREFVTRHGLSVSGKTFISTVDLDVNVNSILVLDGTEVKYRDISTIPNTNIYTDDGTLDSDRIVDQDTNHLTFSGGTGVSIGTGTTSPVCALLELASESQGLLIPRMTQSQRLNISNPLPGLLVYCTDNTSNAKEGMFMYKSLGWVNVL
jgi:hypothetical protein